MTKCITYLKKTVLTKKQSQSFTKQVTIDGVKARMTVVVRFDDECNNGHNTFGVTCTIKSREYGESGGCQHEEIAEWFPELAHLIKYHGCTADAFSILALICLGA